MKKSGLLAASLSAAAISSTITTSSSKDDSSKKKGGNCSKPVKSSASSDKFAPKFDGLRFIETLVTAHR